MSEQNNSRRKLLKSIAAGSGAVIAGKSLPESWSKPVVDSVMLPAHAQTSPSTPIPCTPCLVAALYCDGSQGGFTVDVAIDGTVTVNHPSFAATETDTVDPCTGGTFSVPGNHPQGAGSTPVAGTIPCGTVTEISVTENGTLVDPPLSTTDCG